MPEDSARRELKKLLKVRSGTTDILYNRESSRLEFKETFNLGSRGKYSRSMASFANNKGGYLIYGVEPSPHRIKGVNADKFDNVDPARLTSYLNSHFSPELQWEIGSVEIAGRSLGFIYTHESIEKPVVAVNGDGNDVRESEIYYRYKAQSTTIKYSELRRIIEERLLIERRAWLQHFEAIGKAGPVNVGILDTIHGKLYGGGPPLLIDETLLRKLKFIRQGKFSETKGEPTLKVIGEVQSIAGIHKETAVPKGIHFDDIVTAFLAWRNLGDSEAKSYLREAVFQTSPYVPIHYYRKIANLTMDDAKQLLEEQSTPFSSTKAKILKRVHFEDIIRPINSVDMSLKPPLSITKMSVTKAMAKASNQKEQRSILVHALRKDPRCLFSTITETDTASRLCEAITHLTPQEIERGRADILELLLGVFRDHFSTMTSLEKTTFRKAAAFCDEALAKSKGGG